MKEKPQGFHEAVDDAQRLRGWTHADIAEKLAVRLRTLQNWLKPAAESRSTAPPWAILALTALAQDRPLTERRGALEITYEPAHLRLKK